MLPLPRRHAWLAAPAANTCPRNKPSKQTATAPPTKPQKQKAHQPSSRRSSGATAPNERSRACERISQSPPLTPRAAAPAAACVAGRSRGQHMLPQPPSKQTATTPPPTKPQKQKAHQPSSRRSSGAMAPNERSRGCERISQSPPNPSCCRSRGGMRGWPLPRPTHAPATSPQNKRQQRPPTKPQKQKAHQPSSRRSSGAMAPNERSRACERISQSPPNPSCCRSRGGMRGWPLPRPTHAPATALKTNGNNTQTIVIPESPPPGGLAFPSESRPAVAGDSGHRSDAKSRLTFSRRACARLFRRAQGSSPGPDSSPESAPSF